MAKLTPLSDPLPQPELLLALFYHWTLALPTDSPAAAMQALRAALPPGVAASNRKLLDQTGHRYVGIVHWSDRQQCFWMGFGQDPSPLYRLDPSHLPEEFQPFATVAETRRTLSTRNVVCAPRRP